MDAAMKIVILFAVTVIAWCGELLHIPSAFNNDDAKQQCLNAGYHHLAVIDSQEEHDRMMAYFNRTYGSLLNISDFWIGCYFLDLGSLNGYQAYWITDERSFPVTWETWAPWEPDLIGIQNCTRINSYFDFRTQECSASFGILCEKHDTCPHLVNGSSFTVTLSNGQELGSSANYTCLPGYHSTGEFTRTCQMNGIEASWSGMELNCTLELCPILQNAPTFSISLSNANVVGSVATYTCLPGYSSNNESLTRTCVINGMNVRWSGNEPSCIPSTVPSPTSTTESLFPTTTLTNVSSATPKSTEIVTSPTAHEPSTDAVPDASGARPIFLMPCLCYTNKAFTGMTQEEIIAFLVSDTAIQRNSTTVAMFKKKCREDNKFSSTVIGVISASGIFGILLLIVLSDCYKLIRPGLRVHG